MEEMDVIDRFLATFIAYIDSGFGLLAGDVAYLTSTLIVIDITLAGLFWALSENADVISCDLDGNDLHVVQALLESGLKPGLFIVEYNAKFPPPVRFAIAYDADHRWQGDDYYGASLCSFTDLFARFGYMLVCCNAHTGTNAFFVEQRHRAHFGDVPGDVADIYVAPHQHMLNRYAQRTSPRTVRRILRSTAP